MACVENVCGTGGWSGPRPGDPDNNVVLSARTVFGGIHVSWTYPALNPHAVAHTILYRGPTQDFDLAVEREVVKGSSFYGMIDPAVATVYYYWIAMVSINGSKAELIGPVSAIAQKRSAQLIDDLDGLITPELLDTILKAEIAAIELLRRSIADEINNRLLDNETLQALISMVESANGEALTVLAQEVINRTTADEALVSMIDSMAASIDGNLAAIIEERTVRATADEVLAQNILTLFGSVDDAMAAIVQETSVRVSADEAIATTVNLMTARLDDLEQNGGEISFEEFAEVKADVEGLHGQWGIKIQTTPGPGEEPVIAGIALAVEDPVAGQGASALVFMADKVAFQTMNGKAHPFGIIGNQVNITNAIFSGSLNVVHGTSSNRMEIVNDTIKIFSNGSERVRIGNLG